MKNILFTLEKRGCDFFCGDRVNSDIGNYRVGIYEYTVHGKNGRDYLVEFCRADKYETRTTNKRNGKPLKHPVRELRQKDALHVRTCFEQITTGGIFGGREYVGCFGDCKLDAELWAMPLPYTIKGIEDALLYITGKPHKFNGFTR